MKLLYLTLTMTGNNNFWKCK